MGPDVGDTDGAGVLGLVVGDLVGGINGLFEGDGVGDPDGLGVIGLAAGALVGGVSGLFEGA